MSVSVRGECVFNIQGECVSRWCVYLTYCMSVSVRGECGFRYGVCVSVCGVCI